MIQVRMGNDGSYAAHDLSQQLLWNENEYQSFIDFLEADLSALREHLTDYFTSEVDQETFDVDDAYLDLEALRQAKYALKDIHPFLYYDQGSAVLMDMLAGMLMQAMKDSTSEDADTSDANFRECLRTLIHAAREENIAASYLFDYEEDQYEPTMVERYCIGYVLEMESRFEDEDEFLQEWVDIYAGRRAMRLNLYTLDRLEQIQTQLKREVYWIIDASAAPFRKLDIQQRAALYRGVFGRFESIPDVQLIRQTSFSDPHEATGNRARADAAFRNLYEYSNYPFEPGELEYFRSAKGPFETEGSLIQELGCITDNSAKLSSEAKQALAALVKKASGYKGTGIYTVYNIVELYQLLFLQMEQLMQSGSILKRCRLCNRYFITSDMKVEYCSRPAPGNSDATCSEVGSYRAYQKKLEEDIPLQIYNRAYKTHFARMKKGIMTDKEWLQWRIEAKEKLDQVREGLYDQEEFALWLKK